MRGKIPTECCLRRGLTLVELLIVIAILALLFSLLLPAVQSVRESARIVQCKANLRQVALGCLLHLDSQGTFPQTGAWYSYTGDADLGLKPPPGARQGGWAYSVLPFIEQTALFNLDLGLTGSAKDAKKGERIATPIATYTCPTRGSAIVPRAGPWFGATVHTRTDYAACVAGAGPGIFSGLTREIDVVDGFSNVFLLGERYLNPDEYVKHSGVRTNDQGWTVGMDQDTLARCSSTSRLNFWHPTPDTPGLSCFIQAGYPGSRNGVAFGGPHVYLHMAMADGSVHGIGFDIDLGLYSKLGGMADGGSIDDAIH